MLIIIAVRNFQRVSNRSFVSAFEPIFIAKDYTENLTSKTQKDHYSNKYFFTISSAASIRVLEASEQKEM